MLKKILIVLLGTVFMASFFLSVDCHKVSAVGNTYYVSSSDPNANDNNSGTSPQTPWNNLTKVSSMTFNAGDSILLKCGDTWSGQTLKLNGNGTSSNWINVSSYGTGSRPVITNPGTVNSVAFDLRSKQKEWSFSGYNQVWGWHNNANITNFNIKDGKVSGTIAGTNPSIVTADDLNMSLSGKKFIRIKLKNNTSATTAQIYFITSTDGTWNEAKHKDFTINANDPNYTTYYIDMSTVSGWTGTLTQLRLDPVSDAQTYSGTFSMEHHVYLVDSSAFSGWNTLVQNITGLNTASGSLEGSIAGVDPYIVSADNLNVSITNNKILYISLKNSTSSTNGHIYFTTYADTSWNEAKHIDFTIKANDSEYTTYKIDMSGVSGWTGTLKQLRINPVNKYNSYTGTFGISRISIENTNNYASVGVWISQGAGWKITNIEIKNAEQGIYYFNTTSGTRDGLWIENCYIHDITGFPVNTANINGIYGSSAQMSYGIAVDMNFPFSKNTESFWLNNFTIKNTVIDKTDGPVRACWIYGGNGVIDGLTASNCYVEGADLGSLYGSSTANPYYVKNSTIYNVGSPNGIWWGVGGLLIEACRNLVIENNEIFGVTAPNNVPDGIAVDYEGSNEDITTQNCYFHDNVSSAFLVYRNTGWGVDNVRTNIKNNTIVACGTGSEHDGNAPALIRQYYNKYNEGEISGNNISKHRNSQYINSIGWEHVLTDSYPSSYTVSNNILHKAWEFDDSTTQGWTAGYNVSSLVGNGWHMDGTISNTDPQIYSPDNLNIAASDNKILRIQLKNNSNSISAKVLFTTTTDNVWNEAKGKWFTVNANDPNYTVYTIDFSTVPGFTGTIKQIRLSPSQGSSGTFNINFIRFYKQ